MEIMNYEPQLTPIVALEQSIANLNRQQRKTHELLSNLGFALRTFKNLNQFLELIPLMVMRVTDGDAGAIILFKKNGQLQIQKLHCQSENSCQELRQGIERAIYETLTDSADGGELEFHKDFWEKLESKIESNVGGSEPLLTGRIGIFKTPILLESGERGRLYVFTRKPEYEWTADRQKLLQLLADQTAVAIHNDELTVELRRRERLDRELEIGAEIQEQLLPKKCPDIPGLELAAYYLNADRVGGDYYDFIPANYDRLTDKQIDAATANKWSITIGDVMGKGVPAGLIMTMTRGMLRAEVLNGHSPARILQHLNRVMHADLENSSRFVTLFYSEYDPIAKTLTYANAAHNPPLYWEAATDRISRLDTYGMLIGLDANSQYEESKLQLHPRDAIVYYTDGFTDAVNKEGERFNEENLIHTFHTACQQQLDPTATLDRIVETIRIFVGVDRGGQREQAMVVDDMTMVVIKVKE